MSALLKDDRYLVTSPNAYNSLGVGATQLYNKTIVYNHKRHGNFMLGGREFEFRKKPAFPKTLTKEFLLVDLVNNLDQLAEDRDQVLARVKERALQGNHGALARAAKDYGWSCPLKTGQDQVSVWRFKNSRGERYPNALCG
ncbi:hypothetical protein [Rhizobium wenxiniae]|uniref:hypothetical protein n=1 Tax=Rhizobium wenxiniae TaxID=1737357 RepID=UPI001CB79B6D|nr:hypothetical protein [Rhizobium wenxiniae]